MPTFIELTSSGTGSKFNVNADLVTTFRAEGEGSSLWMIDDKDGESHVKETPDEIRRKVRAEQDLQTAYASTVSAGWKKGRT